MPHRLAVSAGLRRRTQRVRGEDLSGNLQNRQEGTGIWDEERARVRASSNKDARGMWTPATIGGLPIEKAFNAERLGGVEEEQAAKCSHGRAPADEKWGVQGTRTTPGDVSRDTFRFSLRKLF